MNYKERFESMKENISGLVSTILGNKARVTYKDEKGMEKIEYVELRLTNKSKRMDSLSKIIWSYAGKNSPHNLVSIWSGINYHSPTKYENNT